MGLGDEGRILPKKLQKALTSSLRGANDANDELVSEAFVRFFIETVGHYGDYLQDSREAFQRNGAFVTDVTARSIRRFLDWFVETQMFEQFLAERLDEDEEGKKNNASKQTIPSCIKITLERFQFHVFILGFYVQMCFAFLFENIAMKWIVKDLNATFLMSDENSRTSSLNLVLYSLFFSFFPMFSQPAPSQCAYFFFSCSLF